MTILAHLEGMTVESLSPELSSGVELETFFVIESGVFLEKKFEVFSVIVATFVVNIGVLFEIGHVVLRRRDCSDESSLCLDVLKEYLG